MGFEVERRAHPIEESPVAGIPGEQAGVEAALTRSEDAHRGGIGLVRIPRLRHHALEHCFEADEARLGERTDQDHADAVARRLVQQGVIGLVKRDHPSSPRMVVLSRCHHALVGEDVVEARARLARCLQVEGVGQVARALLGVMSAPRHRSFLDRPARPRPTRRQLGTDGGVR